MSTVRLGVSTHCEGIRSVTFLRRITTVLINSVHLRQTYMHAAAVTLTIVRRSYCAPQAEEKFFTENALHLQNTRHEHDTIDVLRVSVQPPRGCQREHNFANLVRIFFVSAQRSKTFLGG